MLIPTPKISNKINSPTAFSNNIPNTVYAANSIKNRSANASGIKTTHLIVLPGKELQKHTALPKFNSFLYIEDSPLA